MLGAHLLLAFDQDDDIDRQRPGDDLVGAARLQEGHDLAFVVAGAAGDDVLGAASGGGDARFERRRHPLCQRIDRLNVVMAVEQRSAPRAREVPGEHDRMAPGRAQIGFEAEIGEVGGDPLRGAAAIGGVRGIRRNRGDPQQREQTFQAAVEIGVDNAENAVQIRHPNPPGASPQAFAPNPTR